MVWAQTTERRDENHLSFVIWCDRYFTVLYKQFVRAIDWPKDFIFVSQFLLTFPMQFSLCFSFLLTFPYPFNLKIHHKMFFFQMAHNEEKIVINEFGVFKFNFNGK